jgi:hypothetical protein
LISADLYACFGGGLPVPMVGDLHAKHMDWNSLLTTTTVKLLRDYADGNSFLIYGPDSPTTNPYKNSATPDVFDIMINRDLPSPVALTSCSALSSDHLSVLIDTGCRSSFQHPRDRPDVRRTDWAKFQTHLEAEIPLIPELHDKDIDMYVESFSGAILGALAASTPKRRPQGDARPQMRLEFMMKYA